MVAFEAAQSGAAGSPSRAAMLAASNAGAGSSASSASGGGLTAEEDVTVLECGDLSQHRSICRSIGLYDVNVFTPPDLVERRDLRRLYLCLRTLSKRTIGIKDFEGSMVTATSATRHRLMSSVSKTIRHTTAALSPSPSLSSSASQSKPAPAALPRALPSPAPPPPALSSPATPPPALPSPTAPPPPAAPPPDLPAPALPFQAAFVSQSATLHPPQQNRLLSQSVRGDYLPNLPTWLGPEQQAVLRSRSPARVPPWVVREGGGPAEAARGRRRSASVTAVQQAPPATVTPRQPTPPRTHTSPLRSISPPTTFHPSEPESLPDTTTMGRRGGGGRMGQQELGLLEQPQEQQGRGLGARKWQFLAAAGAAVLVGGAVVMAAQRHQRLRTTGASSDWESENPRRRSSDSQSQGKGKGSAEAGLESAVGKVESEGGFSHWLASMPTGAKLTEKEFDER
ncbi:unnamed protein product [Closterium sp. Naga37s-1]|nr:unnamed protein product [Closterium sp. Naga37s-1]